MKIKKGFELRELAGQGIVVSTGKAAKTFNGMIRLNGVAIFLWGLLVKGASEEALVSALLAEYDVDEATARADVKSVIATLTNAEVLEA